MTVEKVKIPQLKEAELEIENDDAILETIEKIAKDNRPEYNVLKCCEELAELQERLLKFHLKTPDKKPSKADIAEEMGDVQIRLLGLCLADQELEDLVDLRVRHKVKKLYGYYKSGKFKGGV